MKQLFNRIVEAFSTSALLSLLGLMFMASLPATFAAGCSNQELQRIEDASSKRAMICSAVDELASLSPSVYTARAQQACKAGADLQLIARAYGGCYEVPAESGGSSNGPVEPHPAPPAAPPVDPPVSPASETTTEAPLQ